MPSGCELKQLNCYKDLFVCPEKADSTKLVDKSVVRKPRLEFGHSSKSDGESAVRKFMKLIKIEIKGRKILIKGDPGIGKTTLMKKNYLPLGKWGF